MKEKLLEESIEQLQKINMGLSMQVEDLKKQVIYLQKEDNLNDSEIWILKNALNLFVEDITGTHGVKHDDLSKENQRIALYLCYCLRNRLEIMENNNKAKLEEQTDQVNKEK